MCRHSLYAVLFAFSRIAPPGAKLSGGSPALALPIKTIARIDVGFSHRKILLLSRSLAPRVDTHYIGIPVKVVNVVCKVLNDRKTLPASLKSVSKM